MNSFNAVIFDFDGTIIENEHLYTQAFVAVLNKHGVTLEYKDQHPHPQIPGIGMEENWLLLKEKFSLPDTLSITQLVHETQDEYHKHITEVKIRPGFFEFHQSIRDEGAAIALATSNNWWVIEDELEDLDIHKHFDVLVTGEEVAHKKPAPDIFLKAAEKLFVDPEVCVVLEDTPAGITAAREAGMKVIGLTSDLHGAESLKAADWVVDGFNDISIKLLDSLFA